MKIRYDLFLNRQSPMHSPTFIDVYETLDESETAMKVGECMSDCLVGKTSYLIFVNEGLLCSNWSVELI